MILICNNCGQQSSPTDELVEGDKCPICGDAGRMQRARRATVDESEKRTMDVLSFMRLVQTVVLLIMRRKHLEAATVETGIDEQKVTVTLTVPVGWAKWKSGFSVPLPTVESDQTLVSTIENLVDRAIEQLSLSEESYDQSKQRETPKAAV